MVIPPGSSSGNTSTALNANAGMDIRFDGGANGNTVTANTNNNTDSVATKLTNGLGNISGGLGGLF